MPSQDQSDAIEKLLALFSQQQEARHADVVRALQNLQTEIDAIKATRTNARLHAVATAVTRLADGLDIAEKNRRSQYDEIRDALISVLGVTGEALNFLRDEFEKVPIETLSRVIPHAVISRILQIQYDRGEANTPYAPLPPLPSNKPVLVASEDSEVVARHTETDEGSEDSLTVRTHKDGTTRVHANIEAGKLGDWVKKTAVVVAGVVMVVWNLYLQLKH